MASDAPKEVVVEPGVAEPVAVADPVAAVVVAPAVVVEGADASEVVAPASTPAEKVSPAKEWAAAIALMIVFGFICATFISMLRE